MTIKNGLRKGQLDRLTEGIKDRNPQDEIRKQVIQEIREQREKRGIFGSIPEWVIEIKIREKKAQLEES